jgi:LacI family transcriptional regulator
MHHNLMCMMQSPNPNEKSLKHRSWRSPSIAQIAAEARVGTATVDRVLNGRSSVREATRADVMAALERLQQPTRGLSESDQPRIAFLCESGSSYNRSLEAAVQDYCNSNPALSCPFTALSSNRLDPVKFANLIERTAEESDGLIIVAREDLMINRAIRNVVARKVPVVCLTTDLPTSGRIAYVGSDQTGAGSTAAYLMGQVIAGREGKILLVYSSPYRAQEERELGFRRVLRSEFSNLEIDDRVNSSDESEHSYRNVMSYIESHGPPAGIYNTVGGNIGIGKALTEHGLNGKVVFVGHELNPNSRNLLETGVMNFVIGHDVLSEVEIAVRHIISVLNGANPTAPTLARIRIYTKFSCN